MSNLCTMINDIHQRIHDGEDVEKLVPYDLRGLPYDVKFELIAIYRKYGKNPRRLESIEKWLEANK